MSEYYLKKDTIKERKEIESKYQQLEDQGKVVFITFHPSYAYEQFVEGLTVDLRKNEDGADDLRYRIKPGIIKEMCTRALANVLENNGIIISIDDYKDDSAWAIVYKIYKENEDKIEWDKADLFAIIIDEINRADISKVFGELITLIESDKRLGADNTISTTLPYSNDEFSVPKNIVIFGTMNTADRSISLLDTALRRRFSFEAKLPNPEFILESYDGATEGTILYKSVKALIKINAKLLEEDFLGKDKMIGHSFFFKGEKMDDETIIRVWIHEIFPLLEEYFYDRYDQLQKSLDLSDDIIIKYKGFKRDEETVRKLLEKLSVD